MKKIVIILLSWLLVACEKKELPVPAYERGDLSTVQIEMTRDYRYQVWFSLHDNKVVTTNLKTDWDLAFEAASDGMHVFLNGSKAMRAHKTRYTDLSQVKDTSGMGIAHADMPSGNRDSTAIGNWKLDNKVYILNRGYSLTSQLIGFYKLKIISENATHYTFEYAPLNSDEVRQGIVYKDDAYNFIAFSFSSGTQELIEPKKADYELCFTQYTHLFYDPLQYYQVTGALSSSVVHVARISDKRFGDIVIGDTARYKLDSRRDLIGYDWKSFNLNANLYSVNTNLSYLVKDSRGFYYKLHFIDFVNSSGMPGYPKFEYKQL